MTLGCGDGTKGRRLSQEPLPVSALLPRWPSLASILLQASLGPGGCWVVPLGFRQTQTARAPHVPAGEAEGEKERETGVG